MNLIVNLFIPTIVLGVLNCLVYQALKKSTSLSTQLRRSGRGEEAMRKRDIRLTRIAIVIVGVFLACHLPRFIPNIVEMLFGLPPVIYYDRFLLGVQQCNKHISIISISHNHFRFSGLQL